MISTKELFVPVPSVYARTGSSTHGSCFANTYFSSITRASRRTTCTRNSATPRAQALRSECVFSLSALHRRSSSYVAPKVAIKSNRRHFQQRSLGTLHVFCNAEATVSAKERTNKFPPSLLSSPLPPLTIGFFAQEAAEGVTAAIQAGETRLIVQVTVPETDPTTDVYRLRSVLRIAWDIVFACLSEGKRVKLCVQGRDGERGGIPLSVAGIQRLLLLDIEASEETKYSEELKRVGVANIGPAAVDEDDDVFILVSPTNTVNSPVINAVIQQEKLVGGRVMILMQPRLQDVPSNEGVMSVIGRQDRIEFLQRFQAAYFFRILLNAGTDFPILGALNRKYPSKWQVYEKDDEDMYTLVYEQDKPLDRETLGGIFRTKGSSYDAAYLLFAVIGAIFGVAVLSTLFGNITPP
eukprot:CAMPEP_0184333924 /NCGR_PEP_ID=MMETSP1089-20130417/2853_1 /TAXON_ID=38269 ORGANISM="Gloeochaete wittrockiana, Strain SAG46.84" /NCGR_SAMPLE_ID=MMETSP1089 /ASSEMBLY_ACC=CAM_ASM_000445 /LENGTH=408 /DNA_ID=CAMNT_0026658013 /DNA_START=53 /DNA_END=1279 /DNA_ORIENTATION=-